MDEFSTSEYDESKCLGGNSSYEPRNEMEEEFALWVDDIRHDTLEEADKSRAEKKYFEHIPNGDLIAEIKMYSNLKRKNISSKYGLQRLNRLKDRIIIGYEVLIKQLESNVDALNLTAYKIIGILMILLSLLTISVGYFGILLMVAGFMVFWHRGTVKKAAAAGGGDYKGNQELLRKIDEIVIIDVKNNELHLKGEPGAENFRKIPNGLNQAKLEKRKKQLLLENTIMPVVLVLIFGLILTKCGGSTGDYIIEDSSKRYLDQKEIDKLSEDERMMASLEILARHGVDFSLVQDGGEIQKYFEKKSWYTPTVDYAVFDYSNLNMYEGANLALLQGAEYLYTYKGQPEAEKGKKNEYIFYDSHKRYLEQKEVDKLSEEEKNLAKCEILARHGIIFSNVDQGESIQKYFEGKSWYHPTTDYYDYDSSNFNLYELANLDLLTAGEN